MSKGSFIHSITQYVCTYDINTYRVVVNLIVPILPLDSDRLISKTSFIICRFMKKKKLK